MNHRIETVARAICEAVDGPSDDSVERSHGLHRDGRGKTYVKMVTEIRWHYHIDQARIQIAAFDALRKMESPTPD